MTPIRYFLSYFNYKRALFSTLILLLGVAVILLSSFTPVRKYHYNEIKAGPPISSAAGMEGMDVYQDTNDPNADLHLLSRKQTKLKYVKKAVPKTGGQGRPAETQHSPDHITAGSYASKKPSYYTFLFLYTLF